jgi:hypothetical protein
MGRTHSKPLVALHGHGILCESAFNQCFTDWLHLHPHSDTTICPPPLPLPAFYTHTRSEPVVGHELLGYEYFHHTRLWWWRWSLSLKLLLTWPTYAAVSPRRFYWIQALWILQDTCGKTATLATMFEFFCKTIYNQRNNQNKFQHTTVRYNDKSWMRLYIVIVTLLLKSAWRGYNGDRINNLLQNYMHSICSMSKILKPIVCSPEYQLIILYKAFLLTMSSGPSHECL